MRAAQGVAPLGVVPRLSEAALDGAVRVGGATTLPLGRLVSVKPRSMARCEVAAEVGISAIAGLSEAALDGAVRGRPDKNLPGRHACLSEAALDGAVRVDAGALSLAASEVSVKPRSMARCESFSASFWESQQCGFSSQ